jgi:hypothetical protein
VGFRYIGERIALTLWVGAMWAIGYIAVPVLFSQLQNPSLAGRLAGDMFSAVAYLGIACGIFLLLMQLLDGVVGVRRNGRLYVIVAMIVLVLIGQFGLRPLMTQAHSAVFVQLHGVAQILYLIVSLMGLGLVGFGLRPGPIEAERTE